MGFAKPAYAALILLAWPAFAQPPQPAPPTLKVYSRETIFDVFVADDKGQPVRGLTRSDFTVEEDGKPQPIRGFYEYDRQAAAPPARTLPPGTYTNGNAMPASGPVQIFLFDLLGTRPEDMERTKKYIADYFRAMPVGTQVALFAFSPRKGLVLLQDFTTDGAVAASAVDKLDVEWIRSGVVRGMPIAIAGLNQIAAYVAGIHGRKNLVWIIPGSPPPILHDGGLSWGIRDMVIVHQLMDLYDIFTREQIAVSALDPRGVHGLGFSTLMSQAIAEETGGAPPDNSNDFPGAIAKIVDYTAHGYTVSYVPPRPDEDGHFHPIKIMVARPGLHLSYRTGYNDEQPRPPDAALLQNMIQGPMRLGAIPSTQLLFDLQVQPVSASQLVETTASNPPNPHTKGTHYDVFFQIDPAQIALTQVADGLRTASIEIDLGVYDFYGQLATSRSQTFKLTITPAQYPGFLRAPLKFPLPIDLPSGQLNLRAGLFDTVANKAGTIQIPVTVPKK
jgi:VWFA-related protein